MLGIRTGPQPEVILTGISILLSRLRASVPPFASAGGHSCIRFHPRARACPCLASSGSWSWATRRQWRGCGRSFPKPKSAACFRPKDVSPRNPPTSGRWRTRFHPARLRRSTAAANHHITHQKDTAIEGRFHLVRLAERTHLSHWILTNMAEVTYLKA